MWYPSSNEDGARYSGTNGYHYVTLGPTAAAAKRIAAYREALAARGGPVHPLPGFSGGSAAGINRRIFVADTDKDAVKIAEPAFQLWHASLTKLAREHTGGPVDAAHQTASLKVAMDEGSIIIGSPETVRAEVEKQIREMRCNYMGLAFHYGTLTLDQVKRSVTLFAKEVMAKLPAEMAAAAE